jgi:Polyketide cyclase / dehydrase and lipid transport
MPTGSASITINRPAADVFAAVSDVTRTGEWSPECTGGRWTGGVTGPTVGASFEGDNAAIIAGRTVKKWTTTSKVTACEVPTLFEFVAEEFTTWRYELQAAGSSTTVTESFAYDSKGFSGFIYTTVLRRPKGMEKGMKRTLERLKASLES